MWYILGLYIIFEKIVVEAFQYLLSYLYCANPVACVHIIFLYVDILIVEPAVFYMKPVFFVETEISDYYENAKIML